MVAMARKNHRGASLVAVEPSLLEWAEYWYPISWKGVLVGGLITAIGACATIAFLLLQWRTTTIREEQSDWRTTVLEAETAKAREGTAKANERIAELVNQSEQLRKDTELAAARAAEAELKLAEFRKGRSIGPLEADKIIASLKPFAGTKFDIGHAPSGREQWDFLWLLEPVFPKADWVFVNWEGPQKFSKLNWTMEWHWYGVANVLNVSIELTPEHRSKLLPAAEALAKVLNDIGIAAEVEDHPISGTSATADAIHILVREKR